RIEPGPFRRGDLVLIRLPPDVADLAHQRGYLPKSAYLIKFVLAVAGDRVCRLGVRLFVRGLFVARALHSDKLGRRMPMWHGCRWLAPGDLFVLADNPQSFDSRYFGLVSVRAVVGRAILLWQREKQLRQPTSDQMTPPVRRAHDRADGCYSTGQDKLPP